MFKGLSSFVKVCIDLLLPVFGYQIKLSRSLQFVTFKTYKEYAPWSKQDYKQVDDVYAMISSYAENIFLWLLDDIHFPTRRSTW